jgi:hypothetical protein
LYGGRAGEMIHVPTFDIPIKGFSQVRELQPPFSNLVLQPTQLTQLSVICGVLLLKE